MTQIPLKKLSEFSLMEPFPWNTFPQLFKSGEEGLRCKLYFKEYMLIFEKEMSIFK